MELKIKTTKKFDAVYWNFNLPLQIYCIDKNKGIYNIVNYMPRKEQCSVFEEKITKKELDILCNNTAKILRYLANKFEQFRDGKIDYIYYPVNINETMNKR